MNFFISFFFALLHILKGGMKMKGKFTTHSARIAFGSLLFLLGATSLFLVNSSKILHVLIVALFLCQAVICYVNKEKKHHFYIALVFTFLEVAFLFHYRYIFLCVNAFISITFGFLIVMIHVVSLYQNRMKALQTKFEKALAVIEAITLSVFASAILIIVAFLMVIAVKPSVGIHLLIDPINSYQPLHKSTSTKLGDGTLYINDVPYGKTYPRSFLDMYMSPNPSTSKPTFIYVHGGGFIQGDKTMGNPYAKDESGSPYYYFLPFTQKGFNVVSINYAFAPEYPYPTALIQLSEAVTFLTNHADEYGLDMNNVVIGGNSAGGQIVGQFALIQTNQKYAEQIHIKPVLSNHSIKTVILNSALLEPATFDESTDSWTFDYQLSVVGRAYWGNDFETNGLAKEASIIKYVTKDYPPVFMTDGNTASFYKQAQVFNQKLNQLGIEHKFNFYEKKQAVLTHSYETMLNTEYAYQNMSEMFSFLNQQVH